MNRLPLSYPPALVIAVMAVLPTFVLFNLSDSPQDLLGSRNLALLGNTLALTLFTSLGAVVLGVPLALLTAYVKLPLPRLWLITLAAPLALPSYIGAFTFFAAFGPGGEIQELFGIATPRVQGLAGASLVMALYTYPFVLMTTRSALMSQDANLVNAARSLGMSLPLSLWRIVLPRALNGIAAGALLAALYALSDFGTPAILGLDTFTRVIYVEYNAFGLGQAALLSLQLLAIVGLVLYLESRVNVTREQPGYCLSLWPQRWHAGAAFTAVVPIPLLALALPLSVFGLWLVREGAGGFELSLAWNSMHASLLAAGAAIVLALPVAYAAMGGRFGRLLGMNDVND